MKLFDSVVIACDHSPDMFSMAKAIQGVLEEFGLRVHFYRLVQKKNVLDFLARQIPACEYVVLCCHGRGSDDDMNITLQVVDQVDGEYDNPNGWDLITFKLTPANIPQYIKDAQGTFISLACGSGREPFAKAFLESGYKSYIAPVLRSYNGDAAVLFTIGLFYHLLASDRDFDKRTYTDKEAVERAAALDSDFELGTRVFRYYE